MNYRSKASTKIRKIDLNDSLSDDEDMKLDFKMIRNSVKVDRAVKPQFKKITPRFGKKIKIIKPRTVKKGHKNLFRKQPKIPNQISN